MSKSLNEVRLLGRLGKDADTRFLANGTAVTSLSLATDRRWKDRESGEWKSETDWHKVTLWRKEELANHLTKGKQVLVCGRLQTRSYEDKDGKKQWVTEVVAEDVILLGGERQSTEPAPPPAKAPTTGPTDPLEITDDDIPF